MVELNWKKYRTWIVLTLLFVVFILFFARHTLIDAWRLKHRIKVMRQEQQYYRMKAREDSLFLENLKDDEFLEKYAREKFYMKRPGEEIYLLEEE